MSVKLQNISKSFDSKNNNQTIQALENISFEVKKGEFLCIVGPSGCGKSTIINLIAGFIFPENGKVFVDDQIINKPSVERTVVFQEYALFPWKTVLENIEFGLKCKDIREQDRTQIIKKLLKKMHLEEFTNLYPDELSGGMKQRVALARAFAVRPNIILMDEPFASLDQQTRDILQEELLKFQNEFSQTIIFVTHNIDEAIFLGDRVLILSKRPGHIKSIIKVPFEKPRYFNIRNNPIFLKIRKEIWHSLREEIK